jgi:hypothetical protein
MKTGTCDLIYLFAVYVVLVLILIFSSGSVHAEPKLTQSEIKQHIVDSAIKNQIDPNLALAIAEVESRFNPNAVGRYGELGVFQLRPEFHRVAKGQTLHNINVATKYLAKLREDCKAYGDAFYVCFNYGTARKLKHPRQFPYYRRVQAVLNKNRSITSVASYCHE